MKKNDTKKKAENILTDDLLVDQIRKKIHSDNHFEADDSHLATEIYNAISKQKNTLNVEHKEVIGKKINQSIRNYQRKKLFLQISSAAILFLIIGISIVYTSNLKSEIKSFAENSKSIPSFGNTRLILSGEEIQINTDESVIEYEKNGNTIEIDTAKKVNQKIDKNELVLNTVIVPYGKRTKITLSDNSTIWLNSGSKLIYPARFAKEKREVYLEGEAIFKVSHDEKHPFHVITHDMEVKVLGTVFNVSAYSDDPTTNTTLVCGSVELRYKGNSLFGKSSELMVPDMLAVYDSSTGKVKQTKVDTKLYTSWRDGYIIFEQHPLGEIIKKVSRYYNVSVKLSDKTLANETFSGSLDLKKSANEVMEIIAEIIDAKIENVDDQIMVTRI